ncbi:transketolase [Gordonia hankookensis]|uniref:Transketolase n=1 Tax=Gordonia hankookensis TaxID=589403 RepID=A0ABR7WFC1_9ACTN|nr:transketolase [Gordonia hankookensis]MBD1321475.1 transketolase [Gordonia hankookensis]
MLVDNTVDAPSAITLRDTAYRLRSAMMRMAADKGEGYIAQGLGIADLLAVIYSRQLRFDPADPDWAGRDRFLMSTGHYSIALYAVLADLGVLTEEQIDEYGLNGSELPMSTFDETPGVEITGGSLGHGLGQAVGMALGLRLDGGDQRVIVELSDGELQEGATWESAMSAASFGLGGLTAVVDCNGIQADGPIVLDMEPIADKWRAFGWAVEEVDGNDIDAITRAFDTLATAPADTPRVLIARTTPGTGVPTLVARERAHFVRVADTEWAGLIAELEENRG